MQENTTTAANQKQAGATIAVKAAAIDRIAAEAMALFEGASSFEAELQVAQCIQDLRAALTPEIMRPVMALMNTDLGFLTDRDPRKPVRGQTPTPYTVEDVKDVLIEAKLRGFHTVGNEFNIISKRFYAARNGLKRRCETWPGVTDLKILVGVPRSKDGGAIVQVKGSWKRSGVEDSIETEIAVRVNEYMGTDAIVGKAERKLYKRIFDRLGGRVTNDGEVGDEELKVLDQGKSGPLGPLPPTEAMPPQDEKELAAAGLAPEQPKPKEETKETNAELLGDFCQANGISFDLFAQYGRTSNWGVNWDNATGFNATFPEELAETILAGKGFMLKMVNKWRKEANL